MKRSYILVIALLLAVVLISGCIGTKTATSPSAGPSKINSTISGIQSIQKANLPEKVASNPPTVPPLPIK